jgi:hypothetical protein
MPLTNPVPPDFTSPEESSNLLQTVSARLGSDQTTTSATFVDLLSLSVTTSASSKLLIWASWGASFSVYVATSAMIRLTIDGTEVLRGGEEEWTAVQSGGFVYLATGLSAAPHTIKLQWRIATAGDGTFRCRPSVPPEDAQLVAMEVTV